MKIVRITDPEISVYLLPWYIEDGQSALDVGMNLYERMLKDPENICVLTAVKDGFLKAVLIGYIENDRLFIWQAKKSKDMDRPRLMFKYLCDWGREKGITIARLCSSNKRLRRLYRRKYGFADIGNGLMEKKYG